MGLHNRLDNNQWFSWPIQIPTTLLTKFKYDRSFATSQICQLFRFNYFLYLNALNWRRSLHNIGQSTDNLAASCSYFTISHQLFFRITVECSPEKSLSRRFWKISKIKRYNGNHLLQARKKISTNLPNSKSLHIYHGHHYHPVKKCLIRNFCLVRIFLYSVRIRENTDQKKPRIWTIFTQCTVYKYVYVFHSTTVTTYVSSPPSMKPNLMLWAGLSS